MSTVQIKRANDPPADNINAAVNEAVEEEM